MNPRHGCESIGAPIIRITQKIFIRRGSYVIISRYVHLGFRFHRSDAETASNAAGVDCAVTRSSQYFASPVASPITCAVNRAIEHCSTAHHATQEKSQWARFRNKGDIISGNATNDVFLLTVESRGPTRRGGRYLGYESSIIGVFAKKKESVAPTRTRSLEKTQMGDTR
jgi:hypothetical protein